MSPLPCRDLYTVRVYICNLVSTPSAPTYNILYVRTYKYTHSNTYLCKVRISSNTHWHETTRARTLPHLLRDAPGRHGTNNVLHTSAGITG